MSHFFQKSAKLIKALDFDLQVDFWGKDDIFDWISNTVNFSVD